MSKGTLLICRRCGEAFERHERDAVSVDCPKCRPGSSGEIAAAARNAIICRFDQQAHQWAAWFERTPQVCFGSDLPTKAVRRLLEDSEVAPGVYPLACDSDQCGSSVLHRELTWQPPEILFPCETCRGTGQYAGLIEVGTCQVCGGRKMVGVL
jgi:hypothetical protein